MPDYSILATEINTDPLARGYSGMSNGQVVTSLNTVNRSVVKTVMAGDVRNYLSTQINGTGANQRSVIDMIREFAQAGTIRGASPGGGVTVVPARRSGGYMIYTMLTSGSDTAQFNIANANIQTQFTALGPDGGAGPSILTTTQLQEIAALATRLVSRAEEIGWGLTVELEDVARVRG